MSEELDIIDPKLQMLINDKESGYNYRERRHEDWLENYDLYRDKVQVNRLIQRQSVHIPLMKQTIRTLLKDVDDMPVLYFENLDNDKEAEVMLNAYWEDVVKCNRMELQDVIDKKQVFLYGRSYDQWQVIDGKIVMTVQDPMDILVDRYLDPFNIDSSRFVIHTHIFVPLAELEANKDYDQDAVKDLRDWHSSDDGLAKNAENHKLLTDKNEKLRDLGVDDVDSPVLGETVVELSMHFRFWKEEDDDEEQIYLFVEADNHNILMQKKLEEVIGETTDHYWRTHYPYNSWADDLERQDWYSDAIADIVRGSNKILDVWYSQLVENRTLRSFGMNMYDATIEGFQPQTLPPMPFGWYGVPGKPADVFQKVDIPDLSESLDEMKFIIDLNNSATGATATQQGVETARKVTLGEVELALGEAKERIKGMSKFYTPAWEQRGEKFLKILEAAKDKLDAVTVYKKGKSTSTIYSREIRTKDFMTKSGSRCKVWSQDEKNEKDIQGLEKVTAVSAMIPGNPKLEEIKQRKALEFAGLTPEEINEVMMFEEQKRQAMLSMVGNGMEMPGLPPAVEGEVVPPPQMPSQLMGQA